MTPDEAIVLLDELIQEVPLKRKEHSKAVRAIQSLQGMFHEFGQLRKMVEENKKELGKANQELDRLNDCLKELEGYKNAKAVAAIIGAD